MNKSSFRSSLSLWVNMFLTIKETCKISNHEISPRIQCVIRWVNGRGLLACILGTGWSSLPATTWEVSRVRGGGGGVLELEEIWTWEQRPKHHQGPGKEAMQKPKKTRDPRLLGGAKKGSWKSDVLMTYPEMKGLLLRW